jgi:hypothetical protein
LYPYHDLFPLRTNQCPRNWSPCSSPLSFYSGSSLCVASKWIEWVGYKKNRMVIKRN